MRFSSPSRPRSRIGCLCWAALALAPSPWAGSPSPLTVTGVEPAPNSLLAPAATAITVHFDRAVDPATIDAASFWAFGRWSGPAGGTRSLSDGNTSIVLQPAQPFSHGETVTVFLAQSIAAPDGGMLQTGGYSFQFWTRARPAGTSFTEIDRLDVRTVAAQATQAYGGVGSDLDGDGHLDITVVNEITADLRVFLNKADGSGLYDPFLVPPAPAGDHASPSEPADFNRDGHVDLCVANILDDTVTIHAGLGDGTFGAPQVISVGDAPRGIAVLDADGDGDTDVAATHSGASTLSVMLNDGSGTFGAATSFATGISGPWALVSADMNEDGILDLVTASQTGLQIAVLTGNGSGGFVSSFSRGAGQVWMLAAGDVNGDGHQDMASIDSFDNAGSILLGNGSGQLAAPQAYATPNFGLATDLGDVDGDGDLDWITSSFSGKWQLMLNDGAGLFTVDQQIDASFAASCAVMLDIDNDSDLDLALIDEGADEVILLQQSGVVAPPGVPSGKMASEPLRVTKLDPLGDDLLLSWDSASCRSAVDHQVLHGGGSELPATPGGVYSLSGASCAIGFDGPFVWSGTPDPQTDSTGWIWFLVVAHDGVDREGSWGRDGGGAERSGSGINGSSLQCGVVDKDLSNTCGQ